MINEYFPDEVSSPGSALQELLEERGVTKEDLAPRLGLDLEGMEALLQGKRTLTLSMAFALKREFGAPAGLWLRLEKNFRDHEQKGD